MKSNDQRDASGCLFCHLKGIFDEPENQQYHSWLLETIKQYKGKGAQPVHFSEFRNTLSIGSLLNTVDDQERRQCWNILSQSIGDHFDTLQLDYEEAIAPQVTAWNHDLTNPFHIVLNLPVPSLQATATRESQYQNLMAMVKRCAEVTSLPVDALHLNDSDTLWHDIETGISPKNHYLLRHIRSMLDRIQARQALLVQSRGSLADVQAYFSDGNNEAQLAGSSSVLDATIQAIFTGSTTELTQVNGLFHLPSMETSYAHFFPYTEDMLAFFRTDEVDTLQTFELACFILLSFTGGCTIDLKLLLALCLPPHTEDLPVCEQLEFLFGNQAYQAVGKLFSFRLRHAAFHAQGVQIPLQDHPHIWAVQRFSPDMKESVLCLANGSSQPQEISLDEEDLPTGSVWHVENTEKQYRAGDLWQFAPYEYRWLVQEK